MKVVNGVTKTTAQLAKDADKAHRAARLAEIRANGAKGKDNAVAEYHRINRENAYGLAKDLKV
jgi:hypothetical protein